MPPLTFDQLIAKIRTLSKNSPLELANSNSLIFDRFRGNPVVDEDSEMGMWGVVNKAMDYAYGSDILPDKLKNRLEGGKYGLECVITYLIKARKHSTWHDFHDSLLLIKLERMIDGLISQSLSFSI
jgi:hypothetical protein